MTKEEKELVESLRNEGVSYFDISKQVGVSQDAIRNYFYRERMNKEIVEEEEKFVIRIPDRLIRLNDLPPYTQKGDEEAILDLSDWHYGAEINSQIAIYNTDTAELRITYLADKVTEILLNFHPKVKTIHLFWKGDIVDGENIYPDQHYYSIPISEQIEGVIAPAMYLIDRLSQHFYVDNNSVSGNHGRTSRNSRPNDTFDHVVYTTLARIYPKMVWNISDDWWTRVKILNTTFLLMHGEDTSNSKEPYSFIERAVVSYRKMMGDFDYLSVGHFHHYFMTENVIGNGCVSGSSFFSQRKLMSAVPPSQNLMLVSPKHGRTVVRPINLEHA